ncbi:hypothetical protein [Agromyces sp. NPDC056965]|uniref:DUF7657 domain-containing protein n=1 Tax=Agromyces sp. NPDC056965 TaxID=3345983 RepID=UPI00362BB680
MTTPASADRSRLVRWIARYRKITRPNADGLPPLRVLLAFPALLLIVGVILVALGINGSSSGEMREYVEPGADPALILGEPQFTRSDEWNVQTVWAIAQAEQGFPLENQTFPGGMDTTVPQDLPRADWSVAFRPHLLGFLFLDVDHAIAFKWWVPGLALAAAAYAFLVSVMPRRPGVAAMLATGFFFSPLIQWWYLATTLWPAAWALATMAALIWALRSRSSMSRWIWAAVIAYLTVVMAMGIYVPFIVPSVLVVLFFAVGASIGRLRAGMRFRELGARLVPIITGGVVASAITVFWLATKASTVEAFLGTAYPGARSTPTGGSDALSFASAVGSSFTQALNAQRPGLLGANSSEASTFFYIGIYLLPVIVWIVAREVRARRRLPWELIGLTAVVFLLLAYLFVPGWDAIAKLFLLDLTLAARVRLGLGLASLAMLAYVIRYLDRHRAKAGLWLSLVPAGLFLLSQIAIALVAYRAIPAMLEPVQLWWLWALLSAFVIFAMSRRMIRTGAVAFLIVTVAGSGLTNPVYFGVYDLRETEPSKVIQEIDDTAAGTWVGVGSRVPTAMLLESGVEAFNGFQGAPSESMWSLIDPTSQFEYQWNRLAGVNWIPGTGDPVVSNPVGDQIEVTFDACADFAQEHVQFVLSDADGLDTNCLREIDSFEMPGDSTLSIFEVTPG